MAPPSPPARSARPRAPRADRAGLRAPAADRRPARGSPSWMSFPLKRRDHVPIGQVIDLVASLGQFLAGLIGFVELAPRACVPASERQIKDRSRRFISEIPNDGFT